eukprot:TRINITY_DN8753_c0_g1_i1.p1 TRINITY_DN8753_c0_g1~~TRINITY_DN8753_c0_g1_i1.p1  ORF type:complete len:461 (+),score=22.53 TRINITY_DN8753_c0_g1_i1:86-1468(+)
MNPIGLRVTIAQGKAFSSALRSTASIRSSYGISGRYTASHLLCRTISFSKDTFLIPYESAHASTLLQKQFKNNSLQRWQVARLSTLASVPPQKTDDEPASAGRTGLPEERGQKQVAVWLLICCGMVFVMVVLGGVTRLTESGLSITEWKPLVGSIPPRSQEEWEVEFSKYKQSPEYIKLNTGMTVEEYKQIYWMEWSHREWGRIIGLVYTIPFLYFTYRGYIRGKLLKQCTGMLALLGFQGALGWYMVKSGLEHKNFEENNSVPRVSQYRLAAHLSSAVALYSGMMWISMGILSPHKYLGASINPALRGIAVGTSHLAYLTAFSGAFVAGLDAGLIYNTFPLMGGQLIPEGLLDMKPLWKNFFENDTTVQFDHRVLGISTVTMTTVAYLMSLREGNKLPKATRYAFRALFGMGLLQATLGISTLLTFVPVHLAASHQMGAMTLMSIALWLLHELKRIPRR